MPNMYKSWDFFCFRHVRHSTVTSRNSETRNSLNFRIIKINFRVLWSFHQIKTLELAPNPVIAQKKIYVDAEIDCTIEHASTSVVVPF